MDKINLITSECKISTPIIDIYEYLRSIISACAGFVKTEGFMVVQHDVLMLMSFDRAVFTVIKINPINILLVAEIKEFMRCKDTPGEFLQKTYFLGSSAIYYEMEQKYEQYARVPLTGAEESNLEYYEEDIYNIPSFSDNLSVTGNFIRWTKVAANGIRYRFATAKYMFPLVKGDECSVYSYDIFGDNTRLIRYRIFKKKLKLEANIFTRQFISTTWE